MASDIDPNSVFDQWVAIGNAPYHEGRMEFAPGHIINTFFCMEDAPAEEFLPSLQRARESLQQLRRLEPEIRKRVATDLFGICRDYSGDSDDCPVDPDELATMIELRNITWSPNGDAEIDFATEGELFGEHMPQIWVSADGSISNATV